MAIQHPSPFEHPGPRLGSARAARCMALTPPAARRCGGDWQVAPAEDGGAAACRAARCSQRLRDSHHRCTRVPVFLSSFWVHSFMKRPGSLMPLHHLLTTTSLVHRCCRSSHRWNHFALVCGRRAGRENIATLRTCSLAACQGVGGGRGALPPGTTSVSTCFLTANMLTSSVDPR